MRDLQFESGRLVKVDGARPEYMNGNDLVALVRDLGERLFRAENGPEEIAREPSAGEIPEWLNIRRLDADSSGAVLFVAPGNYDVSLHVEYKDGNWIRRPPAERFPSERISLIVMKVPRN